MIFIYSTSSSIQLGVKGLENDLSNK